MLSRPKLITRSPSHTVFALPMYVSRIPILWATSSNRRFPILDFRASSYLSSPFSSGSFKHHQPPPTPHYHPSDPDLDQHQILHRQHLLHTGPKTPSASKPRTVNNQSNISRDGRTSAPAIPNIGMSEARGTRRSISAPVHTGKIALLCVPYLQLESQDRVLKAGCSR